MKLPTMIKKIWLSCQVQGEYFIYFIYFTYIWVALTHK